MAEITTELLDEALTALHPEEIPCFHEQYLKRIENMDFPSYYAAILAQHQIKKSTAVENSGLEVHYAYQILRGLKHPGRDKILALCIGAGFTVRETNRALERAALGRLYSKRLRDAVMMLAINHHVQSVWKVNEMLAEHGEELLG